MATGSLVDGTLRAQIRLLSRDPFQDALERLLSVKLTAESLQAFADKSPDRWAQAVIQIARAAGYTERLEVKHSGGLLGFVTDLQNMSDSQLRLLEAELENQRTQALPTPVSGVTLSPDASPPKALAPGESTQQQGSDSTSAA